MEKITVGMTIRLINDIDRKMPVGSTATIVYIDDFDTVFIDWTDGGQGRFTEDQIINNFEIPQMIA
ncbi:hypothetical protein SAMN02910447_02705 [Ruminococcus sp. YE71]|uniref:hypothetical protein n=1 Tax=unclassified Ruminococcus TaxID=2608920 RepID=UPI00087ED84A|nr:MULTISPECIES: hypothetical protein [unclassified Ruminococcus]SDA26745.1 hypothetical protein SAMN02910446_02691 [Ruminococcus sp. YE78]SFW44468.1 hypothetical protein SAMN02910447_02705 [Ruminococcus sp. YE71]